MPIFSSRCNTIPMACNTGNTGNSGRGLDMRFAPGEGSWRLGHSSDLDIEVLSCVRTRLPMSMNAWRRAQGRSIGRRLPIRHCSRCARRPVRRGVGRTCPPHRCAVCRFRRPLLDTHGSETEMTEAVFGSGDSPIPQAKCAAMYRAGVGGHVGVRAGHKHGSRGVQRPGVPYFPKRRTTARY